MNLTRQVSVCQNTSTAPSSSAGYQQAPTWCTKHCALKYKAETQYDAFKQSQFQVIKRENQQKKMK